MDSSDGAAAQTGEAGAGGAAGAAPPVSDEQAKRAKAADRQRKRRTLQKLEQQDKEAKKTAKLQRAAQAASPSGDQPAPPAADDAASETTAPGWPSKEQCAAALPGAVMILSSAKLALGTTRYGQALEPRSAEVPNPDGSGELTTVTMDPIRDGLAPPLAAMLAKANGAGATPGQVFFFNLATIFGPVVVAHVAQLTAEWVQKRRDRSASRTVQVKPAPPAAPPVETPPARPPPRAKPQPTEGVIDFSRANGS